MANWVHGKDSTDPPASDDKTTDPRATETDWDLSHERPTRRADLDPVRGGRGRSRSRRTLVWNAAAVPRRPKSPALRRYGPS